MTYKQRLKELLSELRKQRLDGDGKKSRDLLTAIYKEMTGPGQPDLDTATCFMLAGLLMYGDVVDGKNSLTQCPVALAVRDDYPTKMSVYHDICKSIYALLVVDDDVAIDPDHVCNLIFERNK